MTLDNPFNKAIKEQANIMHGQQAVLLIVGTAVLPIFEAVLVNLWTATSDAKTENVLLILLIAVGIFHAVVAVALLYLQGSCSPKLVAEASDSHSQRLALSSDVRRLSNAYRLISTAVQTLNSQTCRIGIGDPNWCKGGFRACVQPLIDLVVSNPEAYFGTSYPRIGVGLYLCEGQALRSPEEELSFILREECYAGTDLVRPQAHSARSPALQCAQMEKAFRQRIRDNPPLFMNGSMPFPDVGFAQFAVCPVIVACGDQVVGALVLFSEGDDFEFASGAEEILSVFAAAISNLAYRYNECVQSRNLPSAGTGASPKADVGS